MEAVLHGPTGPINLGFTTLTIGRRPESDIVMTDPQSSGRHAEIRPEGQGYSIIDVGSANGTFVNDEKIVAKTLRTLYSGDKIRIGNTTFTFDGGIAPTVYVGQPILKTEMAFPPTVAVPLPAHVKKPRDYQPPLPPPSDYTVPATPFNPASALKKPKKRRRGLWVTLTLIIVVLVLAAAAVAAFAYLNRSTAQKTLTAFCTDLKNSDYHDAYQQMSSTFQSTTSEGRFANFFRNQFALGGGLNDCQPSNIVTTGSTGTATITFTLKNTLIPPVNRSSTLETEGGVWKIDNVARQ